VPVDRATVESGCLEFATDHPEVVLPHEAGRIDPAWVGSATWEPLEAAPGDVVVFDSYVPHRSDTNRSDRPRRVLYLTYNAASRGDHRDRYYADKRAELAAAGERGESGHVRISINDDFLGRPTTSGQTGSAGP
jgi:ectoine hydroxylase-related dioxygenase (phytanoyl-CoA dioxygenase family)